MSRYVSVDEYGVPVDFYWPYRMDFHFNVTLSPDEDHDYTLVGKQITFNIQDVDADTGVYILSENLDDGNISVDGLEVKGDFPFATLEAAGIVEDGKYNFGLTIGEPVDGLRMQALFICVPETGPVSAKANNHTINLQDASAELFLAVGTRGSVGVQGPEGPPADPFLFTSGSIPFAGVDGVLSEDNVNLFWDAVNKRCGIGTNNPGIYDLIQATLELKAATGTHGGFAFNVDDGYSASIVLAHGGNSEWIISSRSTFSGGNNRLAFIAAVSGIPERFSMLQNGNFGLSKTLATARIHIKGSTSGNTAYASKFDNSNDESLSSMLNDGSYFTSGSRQQGHLALTEDYTLLKSDPAITYMTPVIASQVLTLPISPLEGDVRPIIATNSTSFFLGNNGETINGLATPYTFTGPKTETFHYTAADGWWS